MDDNEDSPFDFSSDAGGSGDAPSTGSPATSGTEAKDATQTAEVPNPSGETAPEKVGEAASDEMTDEEYEKLRHLANPKLRKRLERVEEELKGLKGKAPETPAELAPVLEAAESLGGVPVLQETAALASTFLDTTLPPEQMAVQVLDHFQKLSREQAAVFRDHVSFTTTEAFPDAFAQFLYGEGVTDAKVKEALKALDADPDADWAETPKPDEKKTLPPEVEAELARLRKLAGEFEEGKKKQTASELTDFGQRYEAEIYSPVDAGLKALGLEPKADDTPEIAARKAEDAEEIRALTERAFFRNQKAERLAKRAAELIAQGDTEAAERLKKQLQTYTDEAFRQVAKRYSDRVSRQAREQRRELEDKRRPELTPQGASAQLSKRPLPAWDEVNADDVAAFGA